jgi:DNA polymerase III delta subunit
LKENAILKEFPLLKESELINYIKNYLGDKKMSDKVIIKFIQKVGNELYRIISELDKLKTYCDSQNLNDITSNMVDDIVF